jgi:hypothetical protein
MDLVEAARSGVVSGFEPAGRPDPYCNLAVSVCCRSAADAPLVDRWDYFR